MRLLVACCRQRNLNPQVATIAEPRCAISTVSRWERGPAEQTWNRWQGSKQHSFSCRRVNFSWWTGNNPLRGSQASSVAHPAACSENFAEFSRQHFSLRQHSRKELEIKLEDKGYSADAISRALDRLAELVPLTSSAIVPAARHTLTPLHAMSMVCHTGMQLSMRALSAFVPLQRHSLLTAEGAKRCRLC